MENKPPTCEEDWCNPLPPDPKTGGMPTFGASPDFAPASVDAPAMESSPVDPGTGDADT